MIQLVDYDAFDRNSDMYTIGVAASPRLHRLRYYHTVRQTFAALRLQPAYARILTQPHVRRAIERTARRCMTDLNYQCQWHAVLGPHAAPVQYLLGNIGNPSDHFIEDVAHPLGELQALQLPGFFSCAGEFQVETMAQVERYLRDSQAPAIAHNAFLLGWERRMLSICRDFDGEVVRRAPRNGAAMRGFLASIEEHLEAKLAQEEVGNEVIAIMMLRFGLEAGVRSLIRAEHAQATNHVDTRISSPR